VAGKEIAVKKYVVRLDAEERDRLDELIRKGKRSAQLLTKARILLKADVSDNDGRPSGAQVGAQIQPPKFCSGISDQVLRWRFLREQLGARACFGSS
jgi:hypothetical protein